MRAGNTTASTAALPTNTPATGVDHELLAQIRDEPRTRVPRADVTQPITAGV